MLPPEYSRGPFPPTPENVWLAILMGSIFGAIIALAFELYLSRRHKRTTSP